MGQTSCQTWECAFKVQKNIRKLIVLLSSLCVDFGLRCEFFAGNTVLAVKYFWVWLLFIIIWLHIYDHYVTEIKLEAHLESLKIYFDKKEDTFLADIIEVGYCLSLERFTFHKSQLCWKFH